MKATYIARRQRLMADKKENTAVVIFSGTAPMKSQDEAYLFSVDRNFFYLTGIEKYEDMSDLVGRIKRHTGANVGFFLKKWLDGGPYKKLNDTEEYLSMNIITIMAFLFAALVFQLILSTGSTILSSFIFSFIFLDLVWYTGGMIVPRIARTNNKKLIIFASLFVTTLLAVIWAIIEFVLLILMLKNI